jgi:hypothetical protein
MPYQLHRIARILLPRAPRPSGKPRKGQRIGNDDAGENGDSRRVGWMTTPNEHIRGKVGCETMHWPPIASGRVAA